MKSLRIARFGGPEVLELVDLPVPQPPQGQVRVRVEGAGLNYSDVMIREGRYSEMLPLPFALGREFCGRVDALGPGVGDWRVGQRVIGSAPWGAMSEYVLAPAELLLACPDTLAPDEGAAALVTGVTALHCLEEYGRLRAGETVLVHSAAGGVGTMAIQIARSLGATVIGTASTPDKRRFVASLGALAVDYTTDDWVREVRRLTGGRGADVILESVGGEIFRRSFLEALAPFGRMVIFGVSGGQPATLDNREIMESTKTLVGYYMGAFFPRHVDRIMAVSRRLVAILAEGQVRPIVSRTFPLDQAAAAFDHLQRRDNFGKVVLAP